MAPGLVRVIFSAQTGGTYALAPGQEPITVAVELNDTAVPPGSTRGRDQCGEQPFGLFPATPRCTFVGTNK